MTGDFGMKILSFLISIVMVFTTALVPAGNAAAQENTAVTSEFLNEETKEVISLIVSNIVNETKTGTSESQEIIDAINNLPVYNSPEEKPERKKADVSPLKKAVCDAAKKLINSVLSEGTIRNFLNHVTNGMYDLYIYLMPVKGEEHIYYFYCDYVDNDNNTEVVFTGIKYNKETGKLYGKDNNGLMGIGFDYDAKNYTVTTPQNVWMRDMGYSILYDIVGGMGFMDTDTVRVRFEHSGKFWMFQFWKGNYGFGRLNGVELGIYNKTEEKAFSYNCATDEEMLDMSITLKNGEETLIEREEMRHWWMCGFRFGPGISPENLTMESTIQFEDEGMMNAFLEAAEEFEDEMEVTADDMNVSIIWK